MHTTHLTQFYYAYRMSLKCPSLYTYVTYKWFQIVIWFHIERVSVPKTYTRHHCIMSSSNLKLKCHIYALYTFYMTLIQWFHIKGKWTVNFQSHWPRKGARIVDFLILQSFKTLELSHVLFFILCFFAKARKYTFILISFFYFLKIERRSIKVI